MSRNIVLPFKTLQSGEVGILPFDWQYLDPLENCYKKLEPRSGLQDWSYDMRLRISRELEINYKEMVNALGFRESEPSFELAITAKAGFMGGRRPVKRLPLPPGAVERHLVEFDLDSRKLCESLTLYSTVFLSRDQLDAPIGSPQVKGSRIWEEEFRVLLEGTSERFPMKDLDFGKEPRLPNNADWFLDWQPSLLAYSFNSVVTLLINSSSVEFMKKLQGKEEILVGQVMAGISCEIATYLIRQDYFVESDEQFPPGSLGSVVVSWFEVAFPGRSLQRIRSLYEMSPNEFSVRLRAMASRL